MKRIFVVLLISLFLLSGCSYRYTDDDVEQMMEGWSDKYYELEEEYFDALKRVEYLETKINRIDDLTLGLIDYFDERTMSFDDASTIFDDIRLAFYE